MTYISDAMRQSVSDRAELRCEYCRLHINNSYIPHEIDHIYAEKHGGKTEESNLCLACYDCNRCKGSDICSLDPVTGEVVALFHPRREEWDVHFQLDHSGVIQPLTPTARATLHILRCNDAEFVSERAWLIQMDDF